MDRRSKLYLSYALIMVIVMSGLAAWSNYQTRNEINDLNTSPPMDADLGTVNIDFLNFISPDHLFWGVTDHETTSIEYKTNETHTWTTLILDLTYNNFSYQAIGENRWLFETVDTGNYTLIQEWNVEGNTTYERASSWNQNEWTCYTALCQIDRIADKTYTLYIDVPTPLIVDELALELEILKLKDKIFFYRVLGIVAWFVLVLGPIWLQVKLDDWNK